MSAAADSSAPKTLSAVALLFLKLGTLAFGGPAAHIAMMEEEVVRRRRWLTHDDFLDLLGATNLIPGPNSTEMAIHIGHRVAGRPGLLVAGVCFIVPATLIVTGIAWAYVTYRTLPAVVGLSTALLAILAAVLLLRYRVNSAWLVLGGALFALLLGGPATP